METKQQKAVAAAIKALACSIRAFPATYGTCNSAFRELFAHLDAAQRRVYEEQEKKAVTTPAIGEARTRLSVMLATLIKGLDEASASVADGTYTSIVSAKITQPLGRLYYSLDVVPNEAPRGTPRVEAEAISRQASNLPPLTVDEAVALVKTSLNGLLLLAVTTTSTMSAVWADAKKAFEAAAETPSDATLGSHQKSSVSAAKHGRSASAPLEPAGVSTYHSAGRDTLAASMSERPTGGRSPQVLSSGLTRLMSAIDDGVAAYARILLRIVQGYAELTRLLVPPTPPQDDVSLFSDGSLSTVTPGDSVTTVPHVATARSGKRTPSRLRKPKLAESVTPQQFAKLTEDLVGDCATLLTPARVSYTSAQVREKTTNPLRRLLAEHESDLRARVVSSTTAQKVAPHVQSFLSDLQKKALESFYTEVGAATLALVDTETTVMSHTLRRLSPYVI